MQHFVCFIYAEFLIVFTDVAVSTLQRGKRGSQFVSNEVFPFAPPSGALHSMAKTVLPPLSVCARLPTEGSLIHVRADSMSMRSILSFLITYRKSGVWTEICQVANARLSLS